MDDLIDLSKVPAPKKKVIREKNIEGPVCNYAKSKHGMLVEKFTSPGKRSVPDRIFSTRYGFVFWIEFKAPGQKPTPKQAKDHEYRINLGCKVFVVDNVEQGKRIIDEMAQVRPNFQL